MLTTHKTSPRTSLLGLTAAVAIAAGRVVKNLYRNYRNRRQMLELAYMDDNMLADIGVTRGDVHAALSSPLIIDPAIRLRVLAIERRAGARAQAQDRIARITRPKPRAKPRPVGCDVTEAR